MAIKKLNPYLMFNGNGAAAIETYVSALGAKVEAVSRYGDTPGSQVPAEFGNLMMQAVLRLGESVVMLTDTTPDRAVPFGSNVQIALDVDDPADMDARFAALSAGGKVIMAPQETFWGARFGVCSDAFGVVWMFNCDLKR
ncbi:MAG: VOC family protein [Myxococcota bacterium]